MEKKEVKHVGIAVGIGVAIFILYLLTRGVPAQSTDATSTETTTNPAYNGPPSYNIPPTLQLPPFNIGNSGNGSSGSGSSHQSGGCGCNACGVGGNGGMFNSLMTMWNNSGITDASPAPVAMKSNLPSPAAIVPPPAVKIAYPALPYEEWLRRETHSGYQDNNPIATRFGGTGIATNVTALSDLPPGLTPRQQYFLWQQVNGNILSDMTNQDRNAAIAAAYASPP